ncbi:MAG TPA: SRPBCC domain-containing protein [Terriglobales bacterium]|nr:SRPBCC domain-containing protein [Terriglobales bacterium]
MSTTTLPAIENFTLNIIQETHVRATIEQTFEALLEQLGPENENAEGVKMSMKIEPWPGGRWFRDLGDGNGHFWGNVQAIKRPTLLEIWGPLFMSFGAVSNVQYRLSEVEGGTLIKFHHKALGVFEEQYRQNMNRGWAHMLAGARKIAERKAK